MNGVEIASNEAATGKNLVTVSFDVPMKCEMDHDPDFWVRDAQQQLAHMGTLLTCVIEAQTGRTEDVNKLEKLKNSLFVIKTGAEKIYAFADEYNVSDVRANGYWSCLRIGTKLTNIFFQKHVANLQCNRIDAVLKDEEICHIMEYFSVSVDVLLQLRADSISEVRETSCPSNKLVASSTEMFIDMFSFLLAQEDHLVATMYGSYCGFWLDSMARYAMVLFVTTIAMAVKPRSALRCLYDARHRGLVVASLVKTADVAYVKRMGSLPELLIYRSLLPALLYGFKPRTRHQFFFPRQSKWIISLRSFKLEKHYSGSMRFSTYRNTRVRMFLHEHPNAKPNNEAKCIFHCHGGGFVIGSPESNEVYLRDWANKLPNVPIISVGYSVSPEAKFPTALQEVLDSYLYLTSGDPAILSMLGFHPKTVAFCGDSAGATLLTAMTMALNDIRHFNHQNDQQDEKSDPKESVTMPYSLTCLYTPFNLSLKLSPSHVLAVADSMISAGVMLSCFDAYLPVNNGVVRKKMRGHESFFDSFQIPFGDKMERTYKEYVNSVITMMSDVVTTVDYFSIIPRLPVIGSWITDPPLLKIVSCDGADDNKVSNEPWYLQPKPDIREYLKSIRDVTSSPYVSPIFYHDFESLSDIELNVVGLHYDPFLDDSITFCKKWQGKKSFRVLDGLQHGFLNFMPFVKEARRGSNLCVDIIKKSLDL